MAPKLRLVVMGMVAVAALLGATLPWRAQKTASRRASAASTCSVGGPPATDAAAATLSLAHATATSATAPAAAEPPSNLELGDTPIMQSATAPSFDVLPPPPTVARLRDEVTENPHVTPPCIMRFAAGWAGQMHMAKDDVHLADQLVTQAEQWVGDSQATLPVIQAICLKNTKLLADAHQTLAQRYEAMRRRAGADVLRLAE